MARISVVSTTVNKITVQLVELATNYAANIRTCDWYIDGDFYRSMTLANGIEKSQTISFTGLSMGTSYSIEAEVYASGWTGPVNFFKTATTRDIANWDWFQTTARRKAYNAVTGSGKVEDFSFTVWNELVDKVNEVKQGTNLGWNSTYASLKDTKMSSTDKVLTAKRFNSWRFNVGIQVSTGINDVSTGDPVYGWYFTTVVNSLNRWIDSLR